MTTMRNLLRVLMALSLATLALPSIAFGGDDGDDWWKQYTLNTAIVSAPPASPPYTVTAKIRNTGLVPISSFTLSVSGLTIVGVTPPASGKVVGSFPGTSVSVAHMRPLFWTQSVTLTLQVSSCGNGAWSSVVYLAPDLKGPTLELDPDESALQISIACGPPVASGGSFVVPDSLSSPGCVALQGGYVAVQRGFYDKDGGFGQAVPVVVTNTVPSNYQLHFQWPDQAGGDALATFQYTVCASDALPSLSYIAWLNTDGSPASTPGTPAYVVAQDCLDNAKFLPEPYGTLQSDNGTTITLDTTMPQGTHGAITTPITTPHALPFDIVVGTERMTVTVCSDKDGDEPNPTDSAECAETSPQPQIWTVTRGVGGTTQVTHTSGLVMSTPLPLLGNTVSCVDANGVALPASSCKYAPGSPALMCIQGQMGENENSVHSTTFIDIGGDGWVNHP